MAKDVEEGREPYEAGNVGGKLKSRKAGHNSRGTTTPYSRPSSGRHASAGPQSALMLNKLAVAGDNENRWIGSGLMDSASKIITKGASFLFSSLLGRRQQHRLPPIPSGRSVIEKEIGTDVTVSEERKRELLSVDKVPVLSSPDQPKHSAVNIDEVNDLNGQSTQLEHLIRQKSISRKEYDQCLEILKSRVIAADCSHIASDEKSTKELEATHQNIPHSEAQRWREERKKYREEQAGISLLRQEMEDVRGSPRMNILENKELFKTPASAMPVYRSNFRDGMAFGRNNMSPLSKTASRVSTSVHGFPNSRAWPSRSTGKAFSRSTGKTVLSDTPHSHYQSLKSEALPSQWTPICSPVWGGREMLKRRISVTDDDHEEIRRTKQKPMRIQDSRTQSGNTCGRLLMAAPLAEGDNSTERLDKMRHFAGKNEQLNESDYVPVQSVETARRILEAVQKMTPSPKERLLHEELVLVRKNSPNEDEDSGSGTQKKLFSSTSLGISKDEDKVQGNILGKAVEDTQVIRKKKQEGFRMNSVFEDTNSDDESCLRSSPTVICSPDLETKVHKQPTTCMPPTRTSSLFGSSSSSLTLEARSKSAFTPRSTTSNNANSGFTFPSPSGILLEAPPTPKPIPHSTTASPIFGMQSQLKDSKIFLKSESTVMAEESKIDVTPSDSILIPQRSGNHLEIPTSKLPGDKLVKPSGPYGANGHMGHESFYVPPNDLSAARETRLFNKGPEAGGLFDNGVMPSRSKESIFANGGSEDQPTSAFNTKSFGGSSLSSGKSTESSPLANGVKSDANGLGPRSDLSKSILTTAQMTSNGTGGVLNGIEQRQDWAKISVPLVDVFPEASSAFSFGGAKLGPPAEDTKICQSSNGTFAFPVQSNSSPPTSLGDNPFADATGFQFGAGAYPANEKGGRKILKPKRRLK